jgi:hypothetical protein
MNKKLKTALKITLFIGFGIVIFVLVYKDFDFKNFIGTLSGIKWGWLIPASLISLLSHVSRARRWQLMLEATGEKPRFANSFFAVLNAYFANLAIPRLGEVTRCALISRYEKQDFSKVLGTVVSERLLDLILVVILTVVAFATQANVFVDFVSQHPEIEDNLARIFSPLTITILSLSAIAGLCLLIVIAKGKLDRFKICQKISKFINDFWTGILSLKNTQHKGGIIFHSFVIWTLYFLMLYFCFFAFDELSGLNLLAALMLFVAGSFGMIVPSPNGMGSYHFMIIQTLIIYGIPSETGASFALVAHGLQTLLIIVFGLISTALIPVFNKNK